LNAVAETVTARSVPQWSASRTRFAVDALDISSTVLDNKLDGK
jgi:hypothetical protein